MEWVHSQEDEHRLGLWQNLVNPKPALCRGTWPREVKQLTQGHKAKGDRIGTQPPEA